MSPTRTQSSNPRRKSGKWSLEEEYYAKQLVTAFENGTLDDCEEGRTLRSYLSMKLNCAPMRISKKFAGQSIGKVRELLNKFLFLQNSNADDS